MPEEPNNIQCAASITYYLLLRWMAGAPSISSVEVAEHLHQDIKAAQVLMDDLVALPYIHENHGEYTASLDIPMWQLCPIARRTNKCGRASLFTYILVMATMTNAMGLTTGQLQDVLGVGRYALLRMVDQLSASDCTIPLYRDGTKWMVATQHWYVCREHDLQLGI